MKLRLALAAATCVVLPLAAHAQPVTGPYVNLEAGTNILQKSGYSGSTGFSGKIQWRPSYAAVAGLGYGFGDGFRVQIDGNLYRNTANKGTVNSRSTELFGAEKKYGPMLNVLYDLNVGWPVSPYAGVGVGYQWAKYNSDISDGRTRIGGTAGSFAYDAIVGVSYPVPGVPGLAVTAEYRFMQLTQRRKYHNVSGAPPGTIFSAGGDDSNDTFLLGVRYQIFNPPPPAPAPAPAPAPVAAPAPAPAKTYLVFFDWDKYNLTPRATDIIAQAASDSKTAQTTTIDVNGYTDTSGTPDYNMGLSWRRAKAVATQLVADGVPASEIQTQGFGETHLLVPTGPGVREPQNRRVEIVLQ
jgi:outer membrane protein OmpA-like peptidoglycan-associated protein